MRPQYTSTKGFHTLVPDDLATIYNIAPLYAAGIDGEGQKIAIIGDSSLDLSDMRAFRQQFNLPYNDPIQILVGDDPGYNTTSSNPTSTSNGRMPCSRRADRLRLQPGCFRCGAIRGG